MKERVFTLVILVICLSLFLNLAVTGQGSESQVISDRVSAQQHGTSMGLELVGQIGGTSPAVAVSGDETHIDDGPVALRATFIVTNTNDSGAGSLRQAIIGANTLLGDDVIVFDISGTSPHTITLTSGQLEVTSNIEVTGPGSESLIIDGNASSRVFHIGSGTTVTMTGLAITNGKAP